MLSVTMEIGQNAYTLLTTLKNPKEQHSFSPPHFLPGCLLNFAQFFKSLFYCQPTLPGQFPQKPTSGVQGRGWVWKIFPLIQNRSSLPPSTLVHLSMKQEKKTDRELSDSSKEAMYAKNFMLWTVLAIFPVFRLAARRLHNSANSKTTHLLQTLKLDMQFFSRCHYWLWSRWP